MKSIRLVRLLQLNVARKKQIKFPVDALMLAWVIDHPVQAVFRLLD